MSNQQSTTTRFWPAMIFVMLGFNVVVVGITVFAAQRYKAAVVDRTYDVTAQHWDQVKAQRERQVALGWSCDLSVDESQARRALRVVITDVHQQPVTGASVEVVCFHNAHAGEPLTLTTKADGGAYVVPVPAFRDGLWTFRVRATTISEEATFNVEREAAALIAHVEGPV